MYNAYHKKEDERELLGPEKIFEHQKIAASKEILWGVGALATLLLMVFLTVLEISAFHGAKNAPISPWIVSLPMILVCCFAACFCVYQFAETATAISCAWGKKYRLVTDTLERVEEEQRERLPFFSFKRWIRVRRYGRAQRRIVTVYHFAKSGKATSRYISTHDGDFNGDSFYLVVREKDGFILGAYNTKKYRLETPI